MASKFSVTSTGCGCCGDDLRLTQVEEIRCRSLNHTNLGQLVYLAGLDENFCEKFQLVADAIGLTDCAGNRIQADTPLVTCELFESRLCAAMQSLDLSGSIQLGVTRLVGDNCQTYTVPETPIQGASSDTITLAFSGLFNHTISASARISNVAGNQLINNNGLYVPIAGSPPSLCAQLDDLDNGNPAVPGVTYVLGNDCKYHLLPVSQQISTANSSSINLGISGNTLSGFVRVNDSGNNILESTTDGLRVTCNDVLGCAPPVSVTDTNTLDLTLVGQNLSGQVRVSGDLQVTQNGISVNLCDQIENNIINGGVIVPGATRVLATDCRSYTIPPESNIVATGSSNLSLVASGHNISGNVLVSPGQLIQNTANGLSVTSQQVINSAWGVSSNFFAHTPGSTSVFFLISNDAGNQLQLGTDGRPYVPTTSLAFESTDCISLVSNAGIIRANPIISAQAGNILECTENGLYTPKSNTSNGGMVGGVGTVFSADLISGQTVSVPPTSITITNPNSNPSTVSINFEVPATSAATVDVAAVTEIDIRLAVSLSPVIAIPASVVRTIKLTANNKETFNYELGRVYTLPASFTGTVSIDAVVRQVGGDATGVVISTPRIRFINV